MKSIKTFVAEARKKGLDDDKIRQLLIESGWSQTQAEAALLGVYAPAAPESAQVATVSSAGSGSVSSAHKPATKPAGNPEHATASISALQAALHHVLLWVFTLTSTIMIGVVASALFGGNDSSSRTLLTYVVMELVTFVPFAVLFGYYLKQLHANPMLGTGRVWSIITVVLHSIGVVGALITLLLGILLVHDDNTDAIIYGAIAVALMNALVVAAYVAANFMPVAAKARPHILRSLPYALFVLIAIFGVLALMRVGPLRQDDQTRQDLVRSVQLIRSHVDDTNALPASLQTLPASVTYNRLTLDSYQICADFVRDSSDDRTMYAPEPDVVQIPDDGYVSEYDFDDHREGNNCWTFKSTKLADPSDRPVRDPGTGMPVKPIDDGAMPANEGADAARPTGSGEVDDPAVN